MNDVRCACGTMNDYIDYGMGPPFISCWGCGVKK